MENSIDDADRIVQMLNDGKITSEEAARLRQSVAAQMERDRQFFEHRERRSHTRHRRRLITLLAFCGVFLLIGIGAGSFWAQSPHDSPKRTTITTLEGENADKRVIDLSALSAERRNTMGKSTSLSISIAALGVAALIGLAILLIYNGLVSSREKVNAGWAQVENVYQRRLDLVPVLIEGVQTYMDHERQTLSELTAARAKALQTTDALAGRAPETIQQLQTVEASQGEVKSALARLFAVVENYPELKASRNFLTLQDQIEGAENRITVERRNFNELSRRYNTKLLTFPSNVVAEMLGFESKPYFQAEATALRGLDDPFDRKP